MAFMLLKTPKQKTAFLHVSCSEWKNIFSMEIYGKQGKLEIFGLGGSYGVERLTYYKMLPEMGPPRQLLGSIQWKMIPGPLSWTNFFKIYG